MKYRITDETGPTTIADSYQDAKQQVMRRWGATSKDLVWNERGKKITRIRLEGREVATIENVEEVPSDNDQAQPRGDKI